MVESLADCWALLRVIAEHPLENVNSVCGSVREDVLKILSFFEWRPPHELNSLQVAVRGNVGFRRSAQDFNNELNLVPRAGSSEHRPAP